MRHRGISGRTRSDLSIFYSTTSRLLLSSEVSSVKSVWHCGIQPPPLAKRFHLRSSVYERYLWNRMEEFRLVRGETGTGKGTAAACNRPLGLHSFDETFRPRRESFMRQFRLPQKLYNFRKPYGNRALRASQRGVQ